MAEDESYLISLRDDFYHDSFGKVMLIIASLASLLLALIGISCYLYFNKPKPTTFPVAGEWRIQPPVPLDQPYLLTTDLLQWVSEAIPRAFSYDFNNYNTQLKNHASYFTADGWSVFLDQLNNYVNYSDVQANKYFVNAQPASAPEIINQGLLSGRYGWWIKMQVKLDMTNHIRASSQLLTLQVLVVRVSTLNNLMGIGIDNVIVVNSPKIQAASKEAYG